MGTRTKDVQEFENHRKNLEQKVGVISDVNPISKNKIEIVVSLPNGDTSFDKTFGAEEFNLFLEYLGFNCSRSADCIIGQEVDLDYVNDQWVLENEETEGDNKHVNHSKRVRTMKNISIFSFLVTISSIIMLPVVTDSAIMLGITLTALIAKDISVGIAFQSTTHTAVHSGRYSLRNKAPIIINAYESSQKSSFIVRCLNAMVLHLHGDGEKNYI